MLLLDDEGGATRHRTATQHVVNRLREAILGGKLTEGSQLLQHDIAEALGVSRTPVREALRILEAEGWVVFSPHRGAVVATLSSDDVRQIFDIRFALESLALRKSIPILQAQEFDNAEAVIEQMEHERDVGRWVDLNRRFHLSFYQRAGSRLLSLIQSQYDAVDRYLRFELLVLDNAEDSQTEHRAILAACRERDVEKAISLCEPHIAEAGEELAEALERRRTSA